MNLREDDQVSAVALIFESEASTAATVAENGADGAAEPPPPAAELGNGAEADGPTDAETETDGPTEADTDTNSE
jgi:hypothetical protein